MGGTLTDRDISIRETIRSWDKEEGNGNMHAFYEDKQLDPVIVL